ncbi:hypothetical protein OCU04_011092 [Sclerotinia nivalis]|uniref:Uncharacterized protein n=1 Tax=Sclerotinia nivalis TaxID=352851 RepID=A0A9X0ADK2_9HELO|nr:hypothetical protein OCU04_011092 [Sclerotinia nivalis]
MSVFSSGGSSQSIIMHNLRETLDKLERSYEDELASVKEENRSLREEVRKLKEEMKQYIRRQSSSLHDESLSLRSESPSSFSRSPSLTLYSSPLTFEEAIQEFPTPRNETRRTQTLEPDDKFAVYSSWKSSEITYPSQGMQSEKVIQMDDTIPSSQTISSTQTPKINRRIGQFRPVFNLKRKTQHERTEKVSTLARVEKKKKEDKKEMISTETSPNHSKISSLVVDWSEQSRQPSWSDLEQDDEE